MASSTNQDDSKGMLMMFFVFAFTIGIFAYVFYTAKTSY